jgi:hypothetical protein
MKINAMAHQKGGSSEIEPLYMVAVQLNTLMALGIATRNVRKENISLAVSLMPDVNIWCPQTRYPTNAIARLDIAMAL